MKSVATRRFWKLYHSLPMQVRDHAKAAFEFFSKNSAHPGLSLERLRADPDSWSVRITRDYRAVGRKQGDTMIWYWIGTHVDFDREFPA